MSYKYESCHYKFYLLYIEKMSNIKLGYITCKNTKEAKTIAATLLNKKLIACGNIVPKIKSIFKWKNKVVENSESILLVKTNNIKIKKIISLVSKIHSYENPCVVFIDLKDGNKKFISWVKKSLK
jgi:periplasmic divalent cation tolerance protein